MKLTNLQIQLLTDNIKQGYIVQQKHPTENLYIYNYTPKAQYNGAWNELSLMCRGLILDNTYQIIARPFIKFFNFTEVAYKPIPNTAFEVYEKLDGSLGILYWINNVAYIATRGSFTSQQAIKATAILNQKYSNLLPTLNKAYTYLFEIIYPENRIVVDYGTTVEIILTAIIEIATGKDIPIGNTGFITAKKIMGIQDFKMLHLQNIDNKEGYIVKFANDYRIKIKFENYLRLHRIITNVSTINIWEYLSNEEEISAIIEQVPDEFYNWVKATVADLQNKYLVIEKTCIADYKELTDKKTTALYFVTCCYPAVLFAMYNNKNYKSIIWKMLRPAFAKPFKNLNEQ